MNKRNATLGLAAVLATGLAFSAAQVTAKPWQEGCQGRGQAAHQMGPQSGPKHGKRNPMMRAISKLDLSAEQEEKIRNLMQQNRAQFKDAKQQIADGRRAFREAVRAVDYDAERVRQLADEQGRKVAQMMVMRAESRQQVRALLTEAQLDELEQMRPQRERRGHGRGHW